MSNPFVALENRLPVRLNLGIPRLDRPIHRLDRPIHHLDRPIHRLVVIVRFVRHSTIVPHRRSSRSWRNQPLVLVEI